MFEEGHGSRSRRREVKLTGRPILIHFGIFKIGSREQCPSGGIIRLAASAPVTVSPVTIVATAAGSQANPCASGISQNSLRSQFACSQKCQNESNRVASIVRGARQGGFLCRNHPLEASVLQYLGSLMGFIKIW